MIPQVLLMVALAATNGAATQEASPAKLPRLDLAAIAGRPHPRLLLGPNDLDRLRVRCGIEGYRDHKLVVEKVERFASHREPYEVMKRSVNRLMDVRPRADILVSAALLHLVTGKPDQPDRYSDFVREALGQERFGFGAEGAVIALDWCWDAIDRVTKRVICDRLLPEMKSLEDPQAVLSYGLFGPRIVHLGAALTFAGIYPRGTRRAEDLAAIIRAGHTFLHRYYVPYLNAVGAVPPIPGDGVWEQAQAATILEFWMTATGENLWPLVRDSLGRCCEPYLWWRCDYPGRDILFARDGGNWYPDWPGAKPASLIPATAFLIARRLDDPCAVWFAKRSLRAGDRRVLPANRGRFEWIPILYDRADAPEIDLRRAPTGRYFRSGFVALRSGWQAGDTVVLFDVGQPFWRAEQHFDAGQFQVYHKGFLTGAGGEDVRFAATRAEQGRQGIGRKRDDGRLGVPGLYDQYCQDTISHNCMMVHSLEVRPGTDRLPWAIWGGQRVIEGHWRQIGRSPVPGERQTGVPLAFTSNRIFDYAAADLSVAFQAGQLAMWVRQLLLIKPQWLLVIDRVTASKAHLVKTWLLQLPAAPLIGGKGLTLENQVKGRETSAGIWEWTRPQEWLTVRQGEGEMHVRTLVPTEVRWRIVGGPAKRRQIKTGPYAGTSYLACGPETFEHWTSTLPTDNADANAWYELGKPTSLGPDFGKSNKWGCLMVQPLGKKADVTLVHLLVIGDREVTMRPVVGCEVGNRRVRIKIVSATGDATAEVIVPTEGGFGGRLSYSAKGTGPEPQTFDLPTRIEPAPPLPLRRSGW